MKTILRLVLPVVLLGCGGGGSPQDSSSSPAPASSAAAPVLPAAVGATITQSTPTSISFQWEASDGAVDYRVARGTQPLITTEETQIRFRDTHLTPGNVYHYTIEALAADGALLRRMSVSGVTRSGAANLTQEDESPSDVVRARSLTSMGWTPNPLYDTCPKWLHDAHWTFGPDNKAYPTWHPPVYEYADGTLCRFGHEHGQDQRESRLFGTVGPLPFGYVNEQLSPGDPSFQRNEDHFGHKVALFNGIKNIVPDSTGADVVGNMECDVLFKLHQGTHSDDSLKNNTHERFLNYKCPNGLEIRYKSLQPFGHQNTFTLGSDVVQMSGASPSNQPSGADRRAIPAIVTMMGGVQSWGKTDNEFASCDNCSGTSQFQNELRAFGYPHSSFVNVYNAEVWQGGPTTVVSTSSGEIFRFEGGPYWIVASSSRYYEPQSSNLIARQIDLCYNATSIIYNSADCRLVRYRGNGSQVSWDSPLSPFNGALRFNETNFIRLYNPSVLRERIFFTPYGHTDLVNDDLPLTRSVTYPIRGYFRATGAQTLGAKLGNWAGSAQCGTSTCYTNFNFFKLRTGQTIEAGVHAPN